MYIIDGQEFELKELNIYEQEKADKYLSGKNPTNSNFTSKEVKELLPIILVPIKVNSKVNNIDYGKITVKEFMKVLTDFFMDKLNLQIDSVNQLKDLTKNLTVNNENIKV